MAFGALLAAHDGAAPTERPLLDSIASALSWMDEMEPVDGLAEVGGSGPAEEPDVAELRRNTFQRFGEASEDVRVGSQTMDRVTALNRLATTPTRPTGERCSMRWSPSGEPSTVMVVPRARIGRFCDPAPRVGPATALRWRPRRRPSALGPARSKPSLHEVLAAWRAVLDPGLVEPWDYRFATGAMDRRLDGLVTRGRLQAINDDHLRSLGADPTALGIELRHRAAARAADDPDGIRDRRDIAREAADGTWRAATPWVFATHAEGGLGNLEELLHESGHALHARRSAPGRRCSIRWLPMSVSTRPSATCSAGTSRNPHSRRGI